MYWEELIALVQDYEDIDSVKSLRDAIIIKKASEHPRVGPKIEAMGKALGIEERCKKIFDIPFLYDFNVYISLVPGAVSHGRHFDIDDVFYWQQQGISEFTVWEDGEEYTYELQAHDCVFIPAGIEHDNHPLTARSGLSIGCRPLDLKEKEFTPDVEGEELTDSVRQEACAKMNEYFRSHRDYTDVI